MQPDGINPNPDPSKLSPSPNPQVTPQPPTPPAAPGAVVSPNLPSTPDAATSSAADQARPVQPARQQPPLNPAAGQSGPAISGNNPSASPTPPPSRRSFKPFLIALIAVLVIGGGIAFAYVGIILPNKPINVLKTAFINSLQQQQISADGTVQGGQATGNGVDYKLGFKTATNAKAKAADTQLSLSVSGVTFPIEARLVNQNLYVKVGDLSTIADLFGTYLPGSSSMVKSFSNTLSNKWIVFDSTLLKESGTMKCALSSSWTLPEADLKLLEDQYAKNPFVTIQSTSNDTVNGQAAEKFVLSINDNKGAAYLKNTLNNLSSIKSLKKCAGGSSSPISTSSLADGDTTPVTIWVNKSTKRIVKITSHSTAQDAKKNNLQGSLTVTLNYQPTSIKAPTNAEPAIQALSQLENTSSGSSLLNLLGSSSPTSSAP